MLVKYRAYSSISLSMLLKDKKKKKKVIEKIWKTYPLKIFHGFAEVFFKGQYPKVQKTILLSREFMPRSETQTLEIFLAIRLRKSFCRNIYRIQFSIYRQRKLFFFYLRNKGMFTPWFNFHVQCCIELSWRHYDKPLDHKISS